MRIWKETPPPRGHVSPMDFGGGPPPERSSAQSLVPEWLYYVRVCGFTFEFHGIEHIRAALAFFERSIQPSSRLPGMQPPHEDGQWRGDHACAQRWSDRLPIRLQNARNRPKVVKALQQALKEFS